MHPLESQGTHTLKGWPRHRLVEIGFATRPSIAKWQFQNSFLFFLGVWVELVALPIHGKKNQFHVFVIRCRGSTAVHSSVGMWAYETSENMTYKGVCSEGMSTKGKNSRSAETVYLTVEEDRIQKKDKTGIWNPIILINRHRFLCQQHRITQCPHCQSSFCPPLKLSFQSRFSMFDNISDWWSYFPTLEGDIPHKWDTWGPIALLESPNLVLISFCIAAILQFIFLNKCRCSGDVTVTSWGRDLETGRFALKAAE